MSLFLGPVHYWLYDKIKLQEALTKAVTKQTGSGEELAKDCPKLEDVIDTDNIHASLQAMIDDAENRFAKLITQNSDKEEQLLSCAHSFGAKHKINENASPEAAYRAFEDFFINGMPCDRINRIIRSDTQSITWKQESDIHEKYYTPLGTDSALYYKLRREAMLGMLMGTSLKLKESNGTYTLEIN